MLLIAKCVNYYGDVLCLGEGDDMSEDHMMPTKLAGKATISDDYFEQHQDAFQPSETPRHLQHRFMVRAVANSY